MEEDKKKCVPKTWWCSAGHGSVGEVEMGSN